MTSNEIQLELISSPYYEISHSKSYLIPISPESLHINLNLILGFWSFIA